MTQKIGIMICRDVSANQPLKPGNTRGHFCTICKKEVQITPHGLPRKDELYVLCNACGFDMRERLLEAGSDVNDQLSPTALETLVNGLIDLGGQKN